MYIYISTLWKVAEFDGVYRSAIHGRREFHSKLDDLDFILFLKIFCQPLP